MKEIVLWEDEETKKLAEISESMVLFEEYDKGRAGSLYRVDSYLVSKEDIKQIYHAIKEEENG